MVENRENPTVSNLFTKLYMEPKCQNSLVEKQFEWKGLISKSEGNFSLNLFFTDQTEIRHSILAKQFLPFPSSSIFQTTYSHFHFLSKSLWEAM